jgi:GDSL-like Lipase/Acylhydrolase family
MDSSPGDVPDPVMTSDAHDWFDTPITADVLRGALDLERTQRGVLPHRLPAWARRQIPDDQSALAEAQPAGVRLVFRTRATAIELDVLPTRMAYLGAPPRPPGVYDLMVDGRLTGRATVPDGNVRTMDMATGSVSTRPGPVGTLRFTELAAGMKEVQIWLPHNEITELVALRTNAPTDAPPLLGRTVWLHHGSSISQGSNAESPTSTWAALAAFAAGVELVNLGFGGGALLDPFVARAMRDTPADLISVKIGINLVNTDLMRLRGFAPAVHGFLDTIRDGHPSTPLLVVSPLLCPIHERTPGPAAPDLSRLGSGVLSFLATGDPEDRTRLTLEIIRDELSRITTQRATEDPNLFYLDGRGLYGEKDLIDLPLPDQLHPDPAAHRRIGRRFAELVLGGDGILTGTSSISNV